MKYQNIEILPSTIHWYNYTVLHMYVVDAVKVKSCAHTYICTTVRYKILNSQFYYV